MVSNSYPYVFYEHIKANSSKRLMLFMRLLDTKLT